MAKLTKIVNGEYIGGNKYKITSTGDGKSTIDFSPDTVLTPGTPVGAEVLNEIQKNGLYTLIGTKRVVGQEDIYDCTFEGIENFDFEEINVLLKPNASSTMQNIFVNVGGNKYKITSISDTSNNVYANQSVGLTLKKSNLQAIKWDIYVHPTQAGYKHIPAGGAVGQVLKNNGDGSAEWGNLSLENYYTKPEIDTKFKNLSLVPVPVGGVLAMYNNTNPAELYSGTTWELLTSDKYIRTGSTPLSTGGSNSIAISKANLPNVKLKVDSFSVTTKAHFHGSGFGSSSGKGAYGVYGSVKNGLDYNAANLSGRPNFKTSTDGGDNTGTASPSTEFLGSGTALTIQPSYITLKFWKRLT